MERRRIQLKGLLQGVGFRPFVFRLATDLGLSGAVWNGPEGVTIEIEGARPNLETFLLRIEQERPIHAVIDRIDSTPLDPIGEARFEIRESDCAGARETSVPPDLATCADCLRETLDPANRRYRYPFTNCTDCGPRFSMIESLPYDRSNTTMRHFPMCDACRMEYENPSDRRFHAEPNACPACGPHLELWEPDGRVIASHGPALGAAADALRQGKIIAVKGLGGFHLMVDAAIEDAVRRLRARKEREAKPLALMFPTLESIQRACHVSELEAALLHSSEAPIVLLKKLSASHSAIRNPQSEIALSVAPDNPYLGVLLPYTPLHHLLMSELGFPVVATSGNRSEEPICTDENDALRRLAGIADLFLVHNRPIVRPLDDSVVRVIAVRPLILRRARGYAPLSFQIESNRSLLAVGGHLKNTVAISAGGKITLSQHLGDLANAETDRTFRQAIADLKKLYHHSPDAVVCDLHPDYRSTQFTRETGLPLWPVQHHYAHLLSCMAEHRLEGPLLGIAWDGSGLGPDGTLWGGEFLKIDERSFQRAAHFRTFRLPGGERAMREPRRSALGLLYETFGERAFEGRAALSAFNAEERRILKKMLEAGFNAPLTSSAGRLFDAVASLLGLKQTSRFEGEAAMALEFSCEGIETEEAYPFRILERGTPKSPLIIDWAPLIEAILGELEQSRPIGEIAALFHNTLSEIMVSVARRIGEEKVVLTGGCFQNKVLTERAVARLYAEGFQPYRHQQIPPNDGGLAVGQILAALRSQKER
ncbi:carbamoyltransferase HypF [Nitrospiraceae bacterium HYJII51-Mn-bac16s-1-B09]|uniref:Carbamoyltransferase n=1 Tax=Candidatus Manganitrophus noduliformans TaxID=2606439 RepID=A0A7X6ID80_9BACT|nr:carbamoyltransferase HypF [Candidatus Manganitrophus noduliformans]